MLVIFLNHMASDHRGIQCASGPSTTVQNLSFPRCNCYCRIEILNIQTWFKDGICAGFWKVEESTNGLIEMYVTILNILMGGKLNVKILILFFLLCNWKNMWCKTFLFYMPSNSSAILVCN